MALAALPYDEMISGFPNPVIPLMTVDPTFEDIHSAQKFLKTN
jgi:hypothetical protein